MTDVHALTLDAGGQRLTFRCDYAVLLKLEAMGEWRELLADALSLKRLSALMEVAALFSGRPLADIIAASPPVTDLQRCVTGAWTLCMEGPEGLRRYQDAVAKEAAADEGKPKAASASSAWQSLKTTASHLSQAFRKAPSGA